MLNRQKDERGETACFVKNNWLQVFVLGLNKKELYYDATVYTYIVIVIIVLKVNDCIGVKVNVSCLAWHYSAETLLWSKVNTRAWPINPLTHVFKRTHCTIYHSTCSN